MKSCLRRFLCLAFQPHRALISRRTAVLSCPVDSSQQVRLCPASVSWQTLISANVLPSPASRWPSAIDLSARSCGGLPASASDARARCAVDRLGDRTPGVGPSPQSRTESKLDCDSSCISFPPLQSRRPPFRVDVCSGFLPTGEFFQATVASCCSGLIRELRDAFGCNLVFNLKVGR